MNKSLSVQIEKIILIFMLLVSFLLCIFQAFDHDEFEAIHTAWMMLQGKIFYIDFFQQKHPFLHFTLMPFIKIFGETVNAIFACKIYSYVIFLLLLYSSYLISKYVFGSKIKYSALIIILSCTFFTDKLTEIRPDTMYMMLSMFSIAFLYKDIKIKKTSLVYSGIFAGLSFAILPKSVIYLIPVTIILLYRLCLKKISLSDIGIYFLTILLVISPFLFYIFRIVNLEEYWFFNFLMNFKFLGTFSPLANTKALLLENHILFFVAAVGFFVLRGFRQKEIAFLSIILFASVFTINVPNKQYFLPAIPFLSMIGANAISKIKIFNKCSIILLLLIVAYPEMLFTIEITQDKNTVQLDKIKYVLEHSKQTDKVYDGSIYFNLFREDVDYFWFSVRPKGVVETYQSIKPREYDIYKLIETKKPKIIYAKYLDVNNKIIKDNYYLTEFDRLYERKDDKK